MDRFIVVSYGLFLGQLMEYEMTSFGLLEQFSCPSSTLLCRLRLVIQVLMPN